MSFKNIVGQDIAIRTLRNIIAQDQVRGTYLFLGPDGVGKRTTAIEFAKMINCERNGNDACDNCASCNKIDSVNHPDVFIIYPEGLSNSIKIDKIRRLKYEASLKPYKGKKRIFIINDGEAMTEEAQNAFLRLLEEPPENHILILTTSNIAGLLPTVISRCKLLKFSPLSCIQIQRILQGRGIDEEQAVLFSHMAMGSIGRAISYKENDMIARRDKVVRNFFFRKSGLMREDILAEQIEDDIEESLYILLYWYRDLLVSKFIMSDRRQQLLNVDRFEEICSYAERFSKEKLQKDLLSIMNAISYVRKNVNPKIALFNMAVELKRG